MSNEPLILVLNSGSSSLKYAIFSGKQLIVRESLERLGNDRLPAIRSAIEAAAKHRPGEHLTAIGHRVVHGGTIYSRPVRITDDILATLETLTPLAPLHEPYNLAGIRAVREAFPEIPQVACFDTAFHATMPKVEQMFGLPRTYYDRGIRQYGFHGLAYKSIVEQMCHQYPDDAGGRIIACHLGNGASLCAIRAGRSVATTMSFTPLDGLMMGTRPGHLDPGVVLYRERRGGCTPEQVDHLRRHERGLLGVSDGISADMRDLLASDSAAANEAIGLFCYRITREIGAMAATIEGVDTIVLSGGIGEHSPTIRERICHRLDWLGVDMDAHRNTSNESILHTKTSRVKLYRVTANEEAVIARHTIELVG